MAIHVRRTRLRLFVFLGSLLLAPAAARAQLLGFNLRGDTGINSGSQPGPGIYVMSPLYFRSTTTGCEARTATRSCRDWTWTSTCLSYPAWP